MQIKVLLADDHAIIRQGLRLLFKSADDMTVVGEAENGKQACDMARDLCPDAIVMDIGMPVMDGLTATRNISAEQPGIAIVALSMHNDPAFKQGMLAAGARGYILKEEAFQHLLSTVRELCNGSHVKASAAATPAK